MSAPPSGLNDFLAAANPTEQPTSSTGVPAGLEDFVKPELSQIKYGSLPEQIKTGLESGASAATFGASKGLERAFGVKPEDIKGREEENPVSSFAGSALGLGASAAASLGAAPLMEAAGLGAAGLAGLGEGAGLASKLGAGAVKGFVEGGLFQGGNEVGKMLLGDPDQTVGTAAANMGLSGLIGAPLGAALSGGQALWEAKFGSKLQKSLEGAAADLTGESAQMNDVKSNLPPDSVGLNPEKPNIHELSEAANRLDVKLTPGTISGEPLQQNIEGNLVRRPSIAGVSLQKEQQAIFNSLEDHSKQLLGDASELTENQAGKANKEGAVKVLQDKLAPIEKSYKELKPIFKEIQVDPALKEAHLDSLINHESLRVSPELEPKVKTILNKFDRVQNLEDLKTLGTSINDNLSDAYKPGGNMAEARLLQTAKDAIKDIRESALQGAEFNEKVGLDTLQKIKDTDAAYGNYKQLLKQMGVEGGLGRVGTARELLDKFGKLSNESFSKRFFDPNDVNQMSFFKQNFPEQFETSRQLHLKDILDKSLSEAQGEKGQFKVGTFLRQVGDKNLNPEARAMLFGPENLQKLQDIKTIYQAVPGNPNPSGTSYAEAFAKMFSPQGIAQNATDALQYAFLKAQPNLLSAAAHAGGDEAAHLSALNFARQPEVGANPAGFKAMSEFIGKTIKGESLLSKSVKNIFKSGAFVIPYHLIPDDAKLDKLDKKLKDLQANNEPLLNVGEKVGAYMPKEAMALAQTSSRAVNYLNSLRPNTQKTNPFDSDPEPSAIEKARFKSALMVAEQPLSVLKDIKNGEISPENIQTLKTIYPALYSRLSDKIYNQMIESVHSEEPVSYSTRLGIASFLGRPLDSSMTPQSILAAQPKPQQPMAQNQPKSGNTHGSMKNINKLAFADATPQQARLAQKVAV